MTKAKADFTIKRNNLTAIKAKKDADAKKPKVRLKDMTPEQKKERYDKMKRKPLTKVEQDFLKDFYYKGKGSFAGRDVMYNAMKAHYAKHKTPKEQMISRRRMWHFFLVVAGIEPATQVCTEELRSDTADQQQVQAGQGYGRPHHTRR